MLMIFRNNYVLIVIQSKTTLLVSLFIFVGVEQSATTHCDYSKSETLR